VGDTALSADSSSPWWDWPLLAPDALVAWYITFVKTTKAKTKMKKIIAGFRLQAFFI